MHAILFAWIILLSLIAMKAPPIHAQGAPPAQTVREATDVVRGMMILQEGGIPPYFVSVIHGMAIIPNVALQDFRHERLWPNGVLLTHDRSAGWSYPVFISFSSEDIESRVREVTGGILNQPTDVVVAFVSPTGTGRLSSKELELDIDVEEGGAAALFSKAQAVFDSGMPIYEPDFAAFMRAGDGNYIAVSLDDAVLKMGENATIDYYGPYNDTDIVPLRILTGGERVSAPREALELKALLDAYTPPTREGPYESN